MDAFGDTVYNRGHVAVDLKYSIDSVFFSTFMPRKIDA